MGKRRWPAILMAALGAMGALYLAQRLVTPKYQTGIVEGSMVEEYYRETVKHDVLFIGDCELYENISPITLWENWGISSYIRGSAQQLVWQSYYLLEDTLRYETPRTVVFNVLALKFNEPQSEAYDRMTLDGMRWSPAKVRSILASMTDEEHFIEYLFPLLRYHDRWSRLEEDDVRYLFTKQPVTHAGYYMRVDVKPQTDFPPPEPLADYTLGEKAMGYLQRMADLCEREGIDLLLVKAPIDYPYWYEQWDEQARAFAEANGLRYLDLIPLRGRIGLDMTTDTYDGGLHLNVQGAEKLADYLGNYLSSHYDLPDRREDPAYAAAWQEKKDAYDAMKRQQYDELARYGELVSFGMNAVER